MTAVAPARSPGRWRRPGPWLLAALVLAAVAAPGSLAAAHVVPTAPRVGTAHPADSNVSFSTNLTDTPSFSPRYLNASVNGSTNLSIFLNNTGALAHTFTLVNANQSGTVLNRTWTPAELDAYFTANGSLVAVNVSAGKVAWANFSLPASAEFRSFEFVSTIAYQFQAGMWGFLNLTPTGPTRMLTENTTDALAFDPNELSAGPNITNSVTLEIDVINQGGLEHTFTVSSQVNTTLTTVANFSKYVPLVNVSVPSGGTVWANFTVPAIGVYEYACTVTGHFAAGMFGFLYVGVPVPPPTPAPSTAIVEVPILVGSAILLGVGVVLAVSSAFTGRLPRKPGPPSGHH